MQLLPKVTVTAAALSVAAAVATADHHDRSQGEKPKIGPSVSAGDPMDIKPSGPAPDFAPDMDPQMQAVIEEFAASEPPTPVTQLTPFQFRNATLPAEAVADLLKKTGIEGKAPKVDVAHKILPVGPEGGILVRTYTPLDAGGGPLPIVVYYHGGGWVIADLDTYDPSARALAEKAGAVVVSVAYRQAPENPYPAAHEDAFAAYEYVAENAGEFGGTPGQVAVAGESAGGNLAVSVALLAKEAGGSMPVHVLSVYPVADGDTDSPSYQKYANAKPLSKPLMEWFFEYAGAPADAEYINLVDADLSGLPATTIINAQIDPLLSDGQELAEAMQSAGVKVERKVYDGVTHEFFGMAAVLEQADEAQTYAADRLKSSFKTGQPGQ